VVTKSVKALSLVLLLSSAAGNSYADVQEVVAEEVAQEGADQEMAVIEQEEDATKHADVQEVVAEEVAKPQLELTYANIDELCKSKSLICVLSWAKNEETDAAAWEKHLEAVFETAQTNPYPHFSEALNLVDVADASIAHTGQLSLCEEELEQDEAIKRTNRSEIDFVKIAEDNDRVQFSIKVNAAYYQPEDWKRIIGRLIEFSDKKNANADDESLTVNYLLESLNEVDRKPVEESAQECLECVDCKCEEACADDCECAIEEVQD
jgi:hypothetical protein